MSAFSYCVFIYAGLCPVPHKLLKKLDQNFLISLIFLSLLLPH